MSLQQSYKQFNKHVQTCCASRRSCPPNYTVRNVWRAPCPDTFSVPVHLLVRLVGMRSAKAAQLCEDLPIWEPFGHPPPHGCHPDPTSACLRQHPNLQFVISTVGGSAMHMERPDDVGREAGIGRTRNRKEPTIFRACPC